MVYDVTEHQQAGQALRASEERLAKARKIAHPGNFEYVVATRTIVWPEDQYRIFGLDPVVALSAE